MKKILFVGLGDLGSQTLDMLARSGNVCKIIISGRNIEQIKRRKNLSLFAAAHLGYFPDIEFINMDLNNIEQSAEILKKIAPDVIYNTATLQSWRIITELPQDIFEALDEAQFGPWLPMHLTLVYKLMQAVKQSSSKAIVVNAAFPDAVNPVLAKIGLEPHIGIGNVANIIPALRYSVATQLNVAVEKTQVILFTQHFFSHRVPRFGDSGGAPYYFRAQVDGQNVTEQLDIAKVFGLLTSSLKRQGGRPGQMLTASSAMSVLNPLLSNTPTLTHAPGPNGLVGGYCVCVDGTGVKVHLPPDLTLEEAIKVNEECQKYDGIDTITAAGEVFFTDENMKIMKEMLNYNCHRMLIEDSENIATELQAKYQEFANKYK